MRRPIRKIAHLLGMTLFGATLCPSVPFAQSHWLQTNPAVVKGPLAAVAWTGNGLIAVGRAGTIMTSQDGKVWASQSSGTRADLRTVAWSGSEVFAAGDSGVLISSRDGVAWTRMAFPFDISFLGLYAGIYGLYAGNGTLLAGTVEHVFSRSETGKWDSTKLVASGFGYNIFNSFAWTGSKIYASSGLGLFNSTDVKNWIGDTVYTNPDFIFWNRNKLYAFHYQGPYSIRVEGASWYMPYNNAQPTLHAAAAREDTVWAVGENGNVFQIRPNNKHTRAYAGSPNNLLGLVWTGNRFVAVGDGQIAVSENGTLWEGQVPGAGGDLTAVRRGPHGWLAYNDTGAVIASADGGAWVTAPADSSPHIRKICREGDVQVGIDRSAVYSSPDGLAWTKRYSQFDPLFDCATFQGITLAVGKNNSVVKSTTGLTWASVKIAGTSDDLLWIVATDSGFLAQSDFASTVLTSRDGMAWTQIGYGETLYPTHAVWNGKRVVQASNRNYIYSSTNGRQWEKSDLSLPGGINDIAWTGSKWIAVGNRGRLVTSPDGLAWSLQSTGTTFDLNAIGVGEGKAIAVGEAHAVVVSDLDQSAISPRISRAHAGTSPFQRKGRLFLPTSDGAGSGPRVFGADGRPIPEKPAKIHDTK